LINHPVPPWINGPVEITSLDEGTRYFGAPNGSVQSQPLTEIAYLGGAAIQLMAFESYGKIQVKIPGADTLGRFSDLHRYLESRASRTPDTRQLAALPVPDQFKTIFQDWAVGKVNFIAPNGQL
jgi:hypothetical protein